MSLGSRHSAQAQPDVDLIHHGQLIYSSNEGIVLLSTSGLVHFAEVFPESQDERICYRVSDRNSLVAYADSAEPTTLTIYDFAAKQIVVEIPWNERWETCNFGISSGLDSSGTHLVIRTLDDKNIILDAFTGKSDEENSEFGIRVLLPEAKSNAPIYRSPVENIYLYTHCNGGDEYVFNGNVNNPLCRGEENVVLYDADRQQQIKMFSDALVHTTWHGITDIYGRGASWSPSGQYVTYETRSGLGLYDMHSDTLSELTAELNLFASQPIWTTDSQYLAYWATDDNILVAFDVASGSNISALDQPYALANGHWVWSPDNRFIAYMGVDYAANSSDLVLIDAFTGELNVLDRDLSRSASIIAWVAV